MRIIVFLGIILLLALPTFSVEMTFPDAISGKTFPLALKLKELDGEWLRVTISGQNTQGDAMLQTMMYATAGIFTIANDNTCYTKGTTVTLGNVQFLVAYAVQPKQLTPQEIEALAHQPRDDYLPEPLTPETPLTLSLLNLRTCGNLLDIRPFNLEQETRVIRRQEDINSEVTTRLRQLALAFNMYIQDNDMKAPPMRTQKDMQVALLAYTGSEKIFVHPETKEPFLPNPKLDKVAEASIKNPAAVIAFYEASPSPDGTRGVSFADGHAKRVPEAEWQTLKKQAGIP